MSSSHPLSTNSPLSCFMGSEEQGIRGKDKRRASQSEETYKFALEVYDKSLAQVEACLKQLSCANIDEVDISVLDHGGDAAKDIEEQCDTNVTKVRGVKFKERGQGKGGPGKGHGRGGGRGNISSRFKSAIEKGKKNKKQHCSSLNEQNDRGQQLYLSKTPVVDSQLDTSTNLTTWISRCKQSQKLSFVKLYKKDASIAL
ncbi:hypothetical protein RIF29_29861 [Crotalaria pallida]|uniref:Uncharacterized protein n=1 Tax=Crotalaria pallida TaxID=3830 RepID=A0AAN9EHF6_CROPI